MQVMVLPLELRMTCGLAKQRTTMKAENGTNGTDGAKTKVMGQLRRSDHSWTSSKDVAISFFLPLFFLSYPLPPLYICRLGLLRN
jgi:hypothetical protein